MVLTNYLTRKILLSALTVATLTATAQAAPVLYFGGPDNLGTPPDKSVLTSPTSQVKPVRDAFLASLSSYGVEDLESVVQPSAPAPRVLTLTFGSTGITGTTSDFGTGTAGLNNLNLFSVSGSKFIYDAGSTANPVNDSITFSEPVTAFGLYISQSGDGALNELTLRLENTVAGTSVDVVQDLGGGWPYYNVIFLGVTDTNPFDRVTFIESLDTDGLLWDDLIAGHVVPEPATWVLLALGLPAGYFARTRSRKRAARVH